MTASRTPVPTSSLVSPVIDYEPPPVGTAAVPVAAGACAVARRGRFGR